jgi:hypothetical protein
MILSAELIATDDLCPRRVNWQNRYAALRIAPLKALYVALDAGFRADHPEQAAENELMALAAQPGLDVDGANVYALAMHLSKLAAIISVALRSASTAPWAPWPDTEIGNDSNGKHTWRSACYDAGDGTPRRIVLVDRWGDERKAIETRGWRTVGELCAIRKPLMLTAVTIGTAHDKRRISPWTRCYRHPRNRMYRFRRTTSSEDFGANWEPAWRENESIPTAEWLTRMAKDECMGELVQTSLIPVPARWAAYAREIQRHALDIARWEERIGEHPPMRLAGCYGFSPCPFVNVCHGTAAPSPEASGFRVKPSLAPLR